MPQNQFSQEKKAGSLAESLQIKELQAKVEKLEGQLEHEQSAEKKEQIVKDEIKNYLQELQQTPPSAAPVATRDESEEISKFPANQQVGALLSLVFEKGLEQAVAVAKSLGNPAIMDEFHDLLVDQYYEELLKQKIIKI